MIVPLLLRFWPYIAMICLAGALYLSVRHNGALSAQLDNAIEVANANAQIIDQERALRLKAENIAAKSAQAAEKARQKHSETRRIILNALPSQDGPIAPVLRDELNRLPEQERHQG